MKTLTEGEVKAVAGGVTSGSGSDGATGSPTLDIGRQTPKIQDETADTGSLSTDIARQTPKAG